MKTLNGFNRLRMCCGCLVVHVSGMFKEENFLSVGFSVSLLYVIRSDTDMHYNC